jgi:hypothetical protein
MNSRAVVSVTDLQPKIGMGISGLPKAAILKQTYITHLKQHIHKNYQTFVQRLYISIYFHISFLT